MRGGRQRQQTTRQRPAYTLSARALTLVKLIDRQPCVVPIVIFIGIRVQGFIPGSTVI